MAHRLSAVTTDVFCIRQHDQVKRVCNLKNSSSRLVLASVIRRRTIYRREAHSSL